MASSTSNAPQNDDRRSQMMSMKMQSIASMSDRHLIAHELLKKQSSMKFTTKSSKDLSSENRTGKLMKMMSAQAMSGSMRNLNSMPSANSQSFRIRNAERNASTSQKKAPVEVDRKEKLMKMHSLNPMSQRSIRTNFLSSVSEEKQKKSVFSSFRSRKD